MDIEIKYFVENHETSELKKSILDRSMYVKE